VATEAFTNSH